MSLNFLVILKVREIDFLEYLLHGDVFIGILLYYVRLGLLDVVAYVPNVQGGTVADYQPHLILINYIEPN
jgi:hypothetical protein